ncbi:MAG TPA: hypothetical protein VFS08_03560 [Gemmatimonadaceae bacterium]|nr:hypothetical protein [Gemmatimonadaceae bacterium]
MSVRMRILVLLHWLLRVQVILGLVQFVGLFVDFAWPAPVWAGHRLIALVAPAVALVAFRRGAWAPDGRPAPRLGPAVRVAARFALLVPLALGLCFSTGRLGGRGWVAVHVAIAVAAIAVVARASAELHRARVAAPEPSGAADRPSGVGAAGV